MAKIKIKTEKLYEAYSILRAAKYTKMSDADKIKLWKITRILKPIVTKYDEDKDDAEKVLKPKDENFNETLAKAQKFEALMSTGGDINKSLISSAEYHSFVNDVWKPYKKLVADAIKPLAEKEVEIEIDVLSEEAFGLLMASNENWVMSTVATLAEIITE